MNGIKFWCYHAGHVLGAAMIMIEIAGVKVNDENFIGNFIDFSFRFYILEIFHGKKIDI